MSVPSTRRQVLHTAVAAPLLGLLGIGGCASTRAAPTEGGVRRRLSKPGPMVPPVPAVLLTVKGAPGDPDEISVVWTFVVNGDPPQIGVSIAAEHVARDLVSRHREFVINVPSVAMVTGFDVVDMNSSKVGDKYALAGLTRGRALEVDAPTIQEAPIQVECRVFLEVDVPPLRRVAFAEVVATTVLEGVCDADGRLDVKAADFFGMTAGSGEFYTMGRSVGHIGQSVGRTDIKY